MKPLVMASASPRRRGLLEACGVAVRVVPSNVDEVTSGLPDRVALTNARRKRDAVAQLFDEPAIVVAADTIVVCDETVLGKPADLEEAREMLRVLSGRTHSVMTALSIGDTEYGRTIDGIEETSVTFRELRESEIDAFVETVRPLDRAGAYTVDGPGALLVAAYDGCYTNVLGLPIPRLDAMLRELGDGLYARIVPDAARFL
jgi:septum formation protein